MNGVPSRAADPLDHCAYAATVLAQFAVQATLTTAFGADIVANARTSGQSLIGGAHNRRGRFVLGSQLDIPHGVQLNSCNPHAARRGIVLMFLARNARDRSNMHTSERFHIPSRSAGLNGPCRVKPRAAVLSAISKCV
ncbi:MAG: hypothetical protein ACXWCY_01025 [Burkholderiales bacterium]